MGFCGDMTFSKLRSFWWGFLSRSPEKAKADDAFGRPLSIHHFTFLHPHATLVDENMEKSGR
jgi:hypothetical protein